MTRALLQPLPPGADEDALLDAFLDYVAAKGLDLYPAQEQAILELLQGHNVILKTPTGSGKSLVAAAMHFFALCRGRRSVYTCPIKALVNEKFLSLCKEFGPEFVGMSTGDATVNARAPILCCTAEVLANMALRQGSATTVDDVIMDEFHYYSDRERGVSWQVPLLTMPRARFLLISATLGNTVFFENAVTGLTRATTVTVASSDRPVPLDFSYVEESLEELLPALAAQQKLPAYLVHFTQRAATDTAQKLLSIDFCSKAEKERLGQVLGAESFKSPFGKEIKKYLRHGIGVHHAGLLPKYRILVEKLAQMNLLKAICGTDTLGVGVNVPIRTVVFTGLCKYDGDKVKILPVRDFHQIAGRAGRKGFDNEGFVIAQAPEHVIENRKLERKAAENPAKAKKFVRRKPPEKGYVHWDGKTFERLISAPPEELQSSFQVGHGMLLNVLSREYEDGCAAMRALLRDCHETPAARSALRRRTFSLLRSMLEQGIVEWLPERDRYDRKLRVNVDLQADFSLNQALSLYLVDTVTRLDQQDPEYALRVLTLVESVLENPDVILRRQVDKLKERKVAELKEQGVEYEDRMEQLQQIEHPKPDRDFIYNTFNEFAAKHPWVGKENIQPKSIAREMFERYLSFADYIRMYQLQRAEGLLLRHLTGTYKTLVQSVPEGCQTEEVRDIALYLEQMVRATDSSLLDEWELLRNPDYVKADVDELPVLKSQRPDSMDPVRHREDVLRVLRDAVFSFLRSLSQGAYTDAAGLLAEWQGRPFEDGAPPPVVCPDPTAVNDGRGVFPWHAEHLAATAEQYYCGHDSIRLDPAARARQHTHLEQDPLSGDWLLSQTLVDRDDFNDWQLVWRVGFTGSSFNMVLEQFEPV